MHSLFPPSIKNFRFFCIIYIRHKFCYTNSQDVYAAKRNDTLLFILLPGPVPGNSVRDTHNSQKTRFGAALLRFDSRRPLSVTYAAMHSKTTSRCVSTATITKSPHPPFSDTPAPSPGPPFPHFPVKSPSFLPLHPSYINSIPRGCAQSLKSARNYGRPTAQ